MAFIPDAMVMGFREVSPTARSLAHYYCLCANQDTGQCWVSQQLASQELGYRLDHIKTYEAELIEKGWIEITPDPYKGRIITIVKGWQSRKQRRTKAPVESMPVPQDLGSEGNPAGDASQNLGSDAAEAPDFPKFGDETSQNLGNGSQNLGKSPQNLGTHNKNNQPKNQPNEPAVEAKPAKSENDDDRESGGPPASKGDDSAKTQPPAQPRPTPAQVYAAVAKRELAFAEIELITTQVPDDEAAEFEIFLRGWSARYGMNRVFKVLQAYGEERARQQAKRKGRLPGTPGSYHQSPAKVADPVAPVQFAVAAGDGERGDGRMGSDPTPNPARRSAPVLPIRARIEEQKRVREALERRRPDLYVVKTEIRDEVECPF